MQAFSRSTARHVAVILAAGVVVRLIYDVHLTDSIFFGSYLGDSQVLHAWATRILVRQAENSVFFRAPLYPYLVALLYRLFDVSPWTFGTFSTFTTFSTQTTIINRCFLVGEKQ